MVGTETESLFKVYGDDLKRLLDLLGNGDKARSYLREVAEDDIFKLKPRLHLKRIKERLRKFRNAIDKARSALLSTPELTDYLIFGEVTEVPEFIPPKPAVSPEELEKYMGLYVDAADRAIRSGRLPKKGRMPEFRQYLFLRMLVVNFQKVFSTLPPHQYDSDFHEAAQILLKLKGYGVREDLERSLRDIKYMS